VVYHTLADLLGKKKEDPQVQAARRAIPSHPLVKRIFKRLNKKGYWGRPRDIHTWWPRSGTTFWVLPVLGDMGLTAEDERIARACEYVFSTQLPSGAFGWDPPDKPGDCHSAIIMESLSKLGFTGDKRLLKSYNWLVERQRRDGGFWCKDTAQIGRPREKEPSCAFATMFVLGALAQYPRPRDSEISRGAVDFLFNCWTQRGRIRYAGHDSQIGTDWEKLKYPFNDYKILKFMDILSQFDFARNRLKGSGMIDVLLSKQDELGRFTPESIQKVWSGFDFGQKEKPSRWVTLLALRIAKRVGSQGTA